MKTLNWSDSSSETKERCSDCPHDKCQCDTKNNTYVEQLVGNIQIKINELNSGTEKDNQTKKDLQTVLNIITWKPLNL